MSDSFILTSLLLDVKYLFAGTKGFKFDALSPLRNTILSAGFTDAEFACELTILSEVFNGVIGLTTVAKESLQCWLLPKTLSDLLRLTGRVGLIFGEDLCAVELWGTSKVALQETGLFALTSLCPSAFTTTLSS
jgi:hypothetical protein